LDISLYNSLKKNLEKYVEPSKLSWDDQLANMIIGDDSILVEKLGQRQKRIFMVNFIYSNSQNINYPRLFLVFLLLYILGAVWKHEMLVTPITRFYVWSVCGRF